MTTAGDPPGGPPPAPAPEQPVSTEAQPPAPPSVEAQPAASPSVEVQPPAPPSVEAQPAASPSVEAPAATDDSLLPATYDDNALQDAVGARPRKRRKPSRADDSLGDDGLPDDRKRSRKMIVVASLALVGGLGIAAFVLFGRINAQRYVLTCTTTHAIAEQGRTFPPWGTSPLPGAEWRAIALPPSAQCKPQQVDDRAKLEAVFLDLLVERASATLSMRDLLDAPASDARRGASPLDAVSMQLEQALLLSRAPERSDQRKQIERMQGDVLYWRASLRLRDATAAIAEASRQFDQAVLARPLHVSDAGAWAEFLRRLAEQLQAGPHGAPATLPGTTAPAQDRVAAPPGTALPVEPPSDNAGLPATTPDAGVPTGGVLL